MLGRTALVVVYLARYERNSLLFRLSTKRLAKPLCATFGACCAIVELSVCAVLGE